MTSRRTAGNTPWETHGRTRTVVLAGASGFIGSYFRARFEQDGWRVRTVGRKGAKSLPSATWDDDDAIT